jgi:hypothetical protein
MKKITSLYNTFAQKHERLFITVFYIIFTFFVVIAIHNIYKKIKQKPIYVGCLYSKTGTLGNASYENYEILLESFKYSIKKNDCNINIIPIYKDLGDDLDNFSAWVEDCVKKYNIKYFFGCWRSTERTHIIPILQKHNARLFYPLQYEGVESSKYVYYFGACPNQQLIPGVKYIFDNYYYYKDVYVIGSDYSYSKISLELIKKFISSTKQEYNKTLVHSKLYANDTTNFTDFIQTLFNKSPRGAIVINLINGESYHAFAKQLHQMYNKRFAIIDKHVIENQSKAIQYFSDHNLKDLIKCSERYPSISTSIFENAIKKEQCEYLQETLHVSNFSNEIITDPIYFMNNGYSDADQDFVFLKKFYENQGKPIGDSQYCSFLTTLFFVETIKIMIDNGENIHDTDVYDKYRNISMYSLAGHHVMRPNNHITKIFFISKIISERMELEYHNFKSVLPGPFSNLSDNKIIVSYADSETVNISERLI